MISTNRLTRHRWIQFPLPILIFLLASVSFGQPATTAPAAATQPAGAAAGARNEQAIVADLQENLGKMRELLGGADGLTDPAKRAQIAPEIVPVLKRLIGNFDELVAVQPMAKEQATSARQQFSVFLALFGDPGANDQLKQMAQSADPVESLRGQGAQLMVRWLSTAKDPAAQAKVADDVEQLAKAHPENEELTGLIMGMGQMGNASPASTDRMQSLVSNVMKNAVADSAKEQIAATKKLAALEGKPLEINGKLLDGKDFSTSAWKGKVILVDFWATWCGPCMAEMPRVKKIYADNHPKGLEALGVSNDYSADDLKKFVAENPDSPWPQLFDPNAGQQQKWNPITEGFGIQGIPTMFLIDKKGIVRTVNARENMEDLIPKLLAE